MTRAAAAARGHGKAAMRCAAAGWLSAALLLLLCTGLPGKRTGLPGFSAVHTACAEVYAPGVIQVAPAAPSIAASPESRPVCVGRVLPRRTHSLREYGLPAPRAP